MVVYNAEIKTPSIREPDNPRQSMEPSDMDPDDARAFIQDLMYGLHDRMNQLPDDDFTIPDDLRHMPSSERGKQHYGKDVYLLLAGIEAAVREWDESAEDVIELKEKYSGKFIEGVEIGERLAVYEGRAFDFTEGRDDDKSKFTFTQ